MEASPAQVAILVLGGGFAVAFVCGLVAAKSNFCTMGALTDRVNMQEWGRMRLQLLAAAFAGTTALACIGQVGLAWPRAAASAAR